MSSNADTQFALRHIAFRDVPPLVTGCRITVVIPARNEAALIQKTLAALVAQRSIDGQALPAGIFDVLVFANNCTDNTAALVRKFAAQHPASSIFVAEETLPPSMAHIGHARGAVMDAAAARYMDRDTDGIIASTDADTIPSPVWIAWTLHEMEHADAVMGRILFDPAEWEQLPSHTRCALAEENIYQFTLSRLGSLLSPDPSDPWPRHWQHWGPSFAVTASAYRAAGGVPSVSVLEDIALYDVLKSQGARIRHSLHARVTTSARLVTRAQGGFGTRLADWNASVATGVQNFVEHPDDTLDRLYGRTRAQSEARPRVAPELATAVLRAHTDRLQERGTSTVAARH